MEPFKVPINVVSEAKATETLPMSGGGTESCTTDTSGCEVTELQAEIHRTGRAMISKFAQ